MNRTKAWEELMNRQLYLRDNYQWLTTEQKAEAKDLMNKLWLMMKG